MAGCPRSLLSAQNPLKPVEALERKGLFARIMAGLAAEHAEEKTVMIDAAYLRLIELPEYSSNGDQLGRQKGEWLSDRSNQRQHEHEIVRHVRLPRAAARPVRHRRSGQ